MPGRVDLAQKITRGPAARGSLWCPRGNSQFSGPGGGEGRTRRPGSCGFLVGGGPPVAHPRLCPPPLSQVNSWSGSIEIGVTALDPSVLDFPSSATGLKGGSWVVSGCSVLRDGRSVLEEYGQDLDQLGEGDRVGVERTAAGELRLWVNGRDCGVAATGLPARVWAVVDLYGKCTQVTVLPPEPGFSAPAPIPTPPLEPSAPPEDAALAEQGTSREEGESTARAVVEGWAWGMAEGTLRPPSLLKGRAGARGGGLLAVGSAAGAEPSFPSHPAWFPAFMVSPAQARPETFPNSLESHNGEGVGGGPPGRGVGNAVGEGGASGEG